MSKELIVYDRPKDSSSSRSDMHQSSWRIKGTSKAGNMCHHGFAKWFGNLLDDRRKNIHLTITLSSRKTPIAYEVTFEKKKGVRGYWASRRARSYTTYCLDGHKCKEMPMYLKKKLRLFLANNNKCYMSAGTEVIGT